MKDYFYFKRSFVKIAALPGVDMALSLPHKDAVCEKSLKDPSRFFYKISLPKDRFGEGFPISGPFKQRNSKFHFDFERLVLHKLKSAGVNILPLGAMSLASFKQNEKLRESRGKVSINSELEKLDVSGTKFVYVFTEFYPQGPPPFNGSGRMICEKISLILLLANGKRGKLKKLYLSNMASIGR